MKVIEKNIEAFDGIELTLLVQENVWRSLYGDVTHDFVTFSEDTVLQYQFDMSYNLSLKEDSWKLQAKIKCDEKAGPYIVDQRLFVPDCWSAFLLTLKSQSPFLTFHLHDIYKNILGINGLTASRERKPTLIQTIVFGLSHSQFFASEEQEEFIQSIHEKHPLLRIRDIDEVEHAEDLSHVLYIGPATLNSLRLCDSGAVGIFLTSQFAGFNLLPFDGGHTLLSSEGKRLTSVNLFPLVESFLNGQKWDIPEEHSFYTITHEHHYGPYLKCLSRGDDHYPFYQAHVVLWNFVLNLIDVNLEQHKIRAKQVELIKFMRNVLQKVIRLQDYAVKSVETILLETKNENAKADLIDGHLRVLSDVDQTVSHAASAHSLIRPVLDYFHIRRGQNEGTTLKEQAQNTLLTYMEEQHSLRAFDELLSTLESKSELPLRP